MRLLTDNPSIDFLRREAKELLAAMRESDSATTLGDAQRVLATEYGFRTWTDLKAEVDRRRVAPPAAPDGLAHALADTFGLGSLRGPMTPIRYEYMGRKWCLETDRGCFMTTPVFDWVCDATAEVGVELMERSRAVGVRVPVAVRTPDGGLVRRVQDENWRVYEWMELGPTVGLPLPTPVAGRFGDLLAAVHCVAPATDQPITGAWVADRPSVESWRALVENARVTKKPWADEFAALSRNVEELSAIRANDPGDSVITGNRDIQPATVRFGPGDDLIVTHWDFSGPTTKEQELATLLAQSALHSPAAARALMDGYRTRTDGDVPTLTLSSFAGYVTGWLTWANHRACEAIGEPPSADAADYAERSIREALDDPLTITQLTALLAAASG